jgi:Uma2 family endonuclease
MMGNREATAMNQTRNLVHRHKMTVEDFRKMGTAGILSDNERIELIDGELIDTAPIGTRHVYVVDHLIRLMIEYVNDDKLVRVQNRLQFGHYGEPEPDIVIARSHN